MRSRVNKRLIVAVVCANKSVFLYIYIIRIFTSCTYLLIQVLNIPAQGLSERNSALDMLLSLHVVFECFRCVFCIKNCALSWETRLGVFPPLRMQTHGADEM